MGTVLSAVQCAARTVYGWGVQCYEAAASFVKSVWKSFTDCLSKLIDLVEDIIKKMTSCFEYSDHTTTATVRQDEHSRQVEVRETKIYAKVGYNCQEEHDPIKEEKKKILELLKEFQLFANEAVDIMENDVASEENPAESEKTAARVKDLMDGQNTRKILDYAEKRSVPKVL